jgi:multicomponent K+:H+ antiporter subunit G
MDFLIELVVVFFIVVSGVFGFVGSYGLVKLRDPMQRLHAPTKATTLGVGGVLLASITYFTFVEDAFSIHELLISVFLFLTAPITANFIAKTWMCANVRPENLPLTGGEYGWAIYDDPPEPQEHAPINRS